MTSLMKKLMLATAVVAAPMMIATTASAEGEKYILVSHAPDSDSWWNTVKNGIALAGPAGPQPQVPPYKFKMRPDVGNTKIPISV